MNSLGLHLIDVIGDSEPLCAFIEEITFPVFILYTLHVPNYVPTAKYLSFGLNLKENTSSVLILNVFLYFTRIFDPFLDKLRIYKFNKFTVNFLLMEKVFLLPLIV